MLETNSAADAFQQSVMHAIRSERAVTPTSLTLRITERRDTHFGCKVCVEAVETDPNGPEDTLLMDDRFKGATVEWAGKTRDKRVIAQFSNDEDNVLYLRGASAHELLGVETLQLDSMDFLTPILNAWKCEIWSEKALRVFAAMKSTIPVDDVALAQQSISARLSSSQKGALTLVNYQLGYLWGPPGTGKTETCAVKLATYLMAKQEAKILVVGIANDPLDQVVQRTDQLLKLFGRNDLRGHMTRYAISAVRHFLEHLLPGKNDALATRRPKPDDQPPVSKDPEMLGFDSNRKVTRLFALSIASAIARIEQLRALGPFDLLLIEEGSQANLAQVLPLMALAKSTVIAGDPSQLSPVAKSDRPEVKEWMARSAFALMPSMEADSVYMLREQRRMDEKICRLVSAVGYNNTLVTAPDCLTDGLWQSERRIVFADYAADQAVVIPALNMTPSPHKGARFRVESASRILEMLLQQRSEVPGFKTADVFVLSPFRLQVRMIRAMLDRHGFKDVRVKTVHQTQGKEATIVIFDPVDGNCPFLKSEEARRLMTVAFSRAKAKLLVLATEGDCANPILQKVKDLAEKLISETTPLSV
ncbi:DNA2/NAM7 helicase-like, C-terminal [Comamonadaceae bacterium]